MSAAELEIEDAVIWHDLSCLPTFASDTPFLQFVHGDRIVRAFPPDKYSHADMQDSDNNQELFEREVHGLFHELDRLDDCVAGLAYGPYYPQGWHVSTTTEEDEQEWA